MTFNRSTQFTAISGDAADMINSFVASKQAGVSAGISHNDSFVNGLNVNKASQNIGAGRSGL